MKIAHVATLLSVEAAYGGPLTVAMEQCSALQARGHDVSLFVGWDGTADIATELDFELLPFRVRKILPTRNVSGLFSRELVGRLHRVASDFDVIHVHFGRDLIALAAAAVSRRQRPIVLQTHGMVMPDSRPRARVLDALTVRRSLRSASTVLYLTDRERAGLGEVSRDTASLEQLDNGIGAVDQAGAAPHRALGPPPRQVIFCARLQQRKRPRAFVEMSELVHRSETRCKFRIFGPDEGELAGVTADIERAREVGVDIEYAGSLSPAAARAALAEADVYVLPSDDEPFPMTVLEALASGTPTVVTESCGLAELLRSTQAAVVSARDPGSIAGHVTELVTDDAAWARFSAQGRELVGKRLSVDAVADRLETIYLAAMENVS